MDASISLPRRAYLAYNIEHVCRSTIDKLDESLEYLESTEAVVEKKYLKTHLSNFVVGLLSHLDAFVSSMLNEIYLCFPGKVGNTGGTLSDIITAGSSYLYMLNVVEKKTMEVLYKSFAEQIETLTDAYSIKDVRNIDPLIPAIAEFKATRDLIAHGEDSYNAIYLKKSGKMARGRIDQNIDITSEYVLSSARSLTQLVRQIHDSIPERIKDWDKNRALKEMWENCHMQKVLPFSRAWEWHPGPRVYRPTEKASNWMWSSSEAVLFDFFMSIYSGYDSRKFNIPYYFSRWPLETYEGKLLLSWLQTPFML